MSKKQQKRERGANYTEEEKTLLAEIVSQFKHIIEDKRTGAIIIPKKNEAWKTITAKYNSNATTGLRQTEQLKALYDNMKQKARKNVGQINKMEYMKSLQLDINETDLAQALENVKDDKVQLNKTGGGSWKPKTTDSDAKILCIIEDQVKPHSNPYDSGAVYFTDNIDYPETMELGEASSSSVPVQNFTAEEIVEVSLETSHQICPLPIQLEDDTSIKELKKIGQINSPAKTMAQKKRLKNKALPTIQKNIKKPEAFKRIYFKTKCQNANLERKKLMQEILHNKLQHNLKMTILKKKLESLNN